MKNIYNFLHIGKTGGCAVIHALQPYCVKNGGNIKLHEHPMTMQHCPIDEHVFMNVRHPEKRFISAFYYVKRHHWPRETNPIQWNPAEEKFFNTFNTANQALEALSSDDLSIRNIANNGFTHAWHIRDKQVQWCGGLDYLKRNINRLFHVNFNETLTEDFAKLIDKLNLPDDIKLPTDKRIANIGNSDTDDKRLSSLARKNLKAHYKNDYALYDYLMMLRSQGKI